MMVDLINSLISFAFGLLIVGGLLSFIYRRQAESWQRLKPFYGRQWHGAIATRHMQSMILYSKNDFLRSYAGIVTIGVFDDGIGIRFMPLLGAFHDPVFVPYNDIKGWRRPWYINAKSVELMFTKLPDLQIIMPASQVSWILAQGFGDFTVSSESPPRKNWPYATYFSAIFLLFVMVAFCVGIFLKADGDWATMLTLLGPDQRASP